MIHTKKSKSTVEFDTEQKIIHHLVMESNLYPETGLFSGKTGIAIFFSHYGRHKQAELYQEIAEELIQDATNAIDHSLSIGIGAGISGIGWGIEYLLQNGFMTGNSLLLCQKIDEKIMEQAPRRITDYSLETGLEGLLHYIIIHLKGCMLQGDGLPFDETYLNDLYGALQERSTKEETTPQTKELIQAYMLFYQDRTIPGYHPAITPFIESAELKNTEIYTYPLGIQKGLAGFLLHQLQIKE